MKREDPCHPRHLGAVAGIALLAGLALPAMATAEPVSFKEDVVPILKIRCLECHQPGGEGYEKSGLDMRTYEGLMKGTKFGPVIMPRRAFESDLVAVIDHRTDPQIWMPHKKKQLSKCERQVIRFWISQGAHDN